MIRALGTPGNVVPRSNPERDALAAVRGLLRIAPMREPSAFVLAVLSLSELDRAGVVVERA